jgi:hypothetical protein
LEEFTSFWGYEGCPEPLMDFPVKVGYFGKAPNKKQEQERNTLSASVFPTKFKSRP